MRRTTMILLVVLAVVLIGGGGVLWWLKDSLSLPWSNPAVTTNTSTPINVAISNTTTNTTPVTTTLPTETKGNTPVDGKLTVGGITITLNSLQRTDAADGVKAKSGEKLLLVYFDPVEAASGEAVDRGLRTAHLVGEFETYNLVALKVASALTTNDRGHMTFAVAARETRLVLELGSGAEAQRVTLP